MRIAWLTPLSAHSGISKYSLAVLPHLARLAEVDVFAPEDEREPYALSGLPVRPLRTDEESLQALREYDLVVHNAGNNPEFHDVIYSVYRQVSGVVVVHDKRMHGFFHHLWSVSEGRPEYYARMMRYYYGEAGEEAAAAVLRGGVSVDSYDAFPLIEPFLWNATAVVVHSSEALDLVGSRYRSLMPADELGLPFVPDPSLGPLLTRTELGVQDSEVLLVSHGGVYVQKRLESVLRAIAGDVQLRDIVRLAIVGGGAPDYLARLESIIAELGIAARVTVTGRVDDRTMYSWVAACDVAVNLRYPSMESASLSLIEQMYYGKPVIASDVSYYSQLPDDVALKVPVATESLDLPGAIRRLVLDKTYRQAMGDAAKRYVTERHDPARYAEEFVRFAETLPGTTRALRALDARSDAMLACNPPDLAELADAEAARVLEGVTPR